MKNLVKDILRNKKAVFFLKYYFLFMLLLLVLISSSLMRIISIESNPFFYANF
jgi:hypothetical protein